MTKVFHNGNGGRNGHHRYRYDTGRNGRYGPRIGRYGPFYFLKKNLFSDRYGAVTVRYGAVSDRYGADTGPYRSDTGRYGAVTARFFCNGRYGRFNPVTRNGHDRFRYVSADTADT